MTHTENELTALDTKRYTLKDTAEQLGLVYEGVVIWMYEEGYFDKSGQLTQKAVDSGYFEMRMMH